MTKRFIKFSRTFANSLYRPVRPLLNPLRQSFVLTLLLIATLSAAVAGRFYAFDPEYALWEQAAWRPWQSQANYLKERAEIAAWEKLNEMRPYSKDILIKLALLYAQINEAEKARDYFNQAEYLDPAISPLPFYRP